MSTLVELAVQELIKTYHPHTIILYGSRARGDSTAQSDIDIACFRDESEEVKDARLFHDAYLDAWVYPTSSLKDISSSTFRFGDGYVVLDERGLGEPFLRQIREKLAKGPALISQADRAHLKQWIDKMLSRALIDNLDGHYRRTWLQFELLNIYFELRGMWFLGHKKSFNYLQSHDPQAYCLFEAMYCHPECIDNLQPLVCYVFDEKPNCSTD